MINKILLLFLRTPMLPFLASKRLTLKHQWLAGFDNAQIISNLHYMVQHIPVTLRYVIIPGLTNLPEDLQALVNLIYFLPETCSYRVTSLSPPTVGNIFPGAQPFVTTSRPAELAIAPPVNEATCRW